MLSTINYTRPFLSNPKALIKTSCSNSFFRPSQLQEESQSSITHLSSPLQTSSNTAFNTSRIISKISRINCGK
jgi:hypothetical protein